MWLLFACTEPPPADDRPETPTDTASREPWEPEVACELTTPRPVVAEDLDLDRYYGFYGPTIIDLVALEYEFPYYSKEFGCPTASESEAGTTWSGECESEEWSWSGWWTTADTDTGDDSLHSMSGDARWADEYGYGWEVGFVGEAVVTQTGEDQTIGREFAMTLADYRDDLDGAWTVSAEDSSHAGHHVGVTRTSATLEAEAGESCVVYDYAYVDGCDLEPAGGMAIVGTATATLAWDPEEACDGCGRVFLDGEEVGTVCDGWWVP